MPMPSTRQVTIRQKQRQKQAFAPTETMNWPKVLAAPVSVIVPMITPTSAQAIATGRAVFALRQARLDISPGSPRPPFRKAVAGNQQRQRCDDHADAELEEGGRTSPRPDPEDDAYDTGGKAERERTAEDQKAGEGEADRTGEKRRIAGEQQPDERGERQDQMPLFEDCRLGPKAAVPWAGERPTCRLRDGRSRRPTRNRGSRYDRRLTIS